MKGIIGLIGLGVNYADFRRIEPLQDICRKIMREFLLIVQAEHIYLGDENIEEIIRIARKHRIQVPVNETMYMLIRAKESLYRNMGLNGGL